MNFDDLQSDAEDAAQEILEGIRQKAVLAITRAQLTVYGVKGAKSEIEREIDSAFSSGRYKFEDYLKQAWAAGLEDEHSPKSALSPEIDTMFEELVSAFGELAASMRTKIINAITRGLLANSTKDDIIKTIGDDARQGLFDGFTARAVGTVSHEMQMAYYHAKESRIEEIGKALEATKRFTQLGQTPKGSATASGRALGGQKHPVAIKVWLHSMHGNPPRYHHLALHGKAVMSDQTFTINAPKGIVYHAPGPHTPALPAGEKINCRCTTAPQILMLTDSEERELRARMAATGGSTSDEWEEIANRSMSTTLRDSGENPVELGKHLISKAKPLAEAAHSH